MAFKVTYGCDACGHRFKHKQATMSEPVPACPACLAPPVDDSAERDARIAGMIEMGKPPGMKSARARAVEHTQKIMEEDYGYTNFRDNAREGENAVIPQRAMSTQETEQLGQVLAEYRDQTADAPKAPEQSAVTQHISPNFWQNMGAAAPAGKAGAEAARSLGADPIKLIERPKNASRIPRMIVEGTYTP